MEEGAEKTARPSPWEEAIGRAERRMRERKMLGWVLLVVVVEVVVVEGGGGGALMRTMVSYATRKEMS